MIIGKLKPLKDEFKIRPAEPFYALNSRVNLDRSVAQRGERNSRARITEDDVRYIRGSKSSLRELAEYFRVSKSAIANIKAKRTWRHVE